ncbi:MAG: DUF72 domain-containing protein [Chloroflexi bacterium]|nr:DUF72 domain-containing protein [Chloroflexota bacterium]
MNTGQRSAGVAVRVGTSGWSYPHWRSVFYPRDLSADQELAYYARHFDTVEINASFYRLPQREQFASWHDQTPPGFCFAVKASRFLTHMKKLREPAAPLQRLLDSAGGLGEKLGPILYQFPAQWSKNLPRLSAFLDLLPRTVRHVFEFRHPTWYEPDVLDALARHGCALALPVHPALPCARVVSAPFTYVRFHHGATGPRFTAEEIADWATWLAGQARAGVDVYAYFNNDVEGYAVANAESLRSRFRGSGVG